MATVSKRVDFFNSEEGVEIEQILMQMTTDTAYNTNSIYSANTDLYPDNQMSFVDKHMNYLRCHPAIDTRQYLSNLRLMTKLK